MAKQYALFCYLPFHYGDLTVVPTSVPFGPTLFSTVENYAQRDSEFLLLMPKPETIESIQATLQPLEALQGEQTQLETWVHDSFGALEKLHEELSDWQTELARKQTELDLREDALEKCKVEGSDLDEHVVQWKQELDEAREEIHQLEEENAEQIQELENLERRHRRMQTELAAAKQHSEDLSTALEDERSLSSEFQDIRQLVEKQCLLLEDHLGEDHPDVIAQKDKSSENKAEASSRSVKLRRRAESRQAAKRRKRRTTEESDE